MSTDCDGGTSVLHTAFGDRVAPNVRFAIGVTVAIALLIVGALAAYAAVLNWRSYAQAARLRTAVADMDPPPPSELVVGPSRERVRLVPSSAQHHALGWAATLSSLVAAATLAGGAAVVALVVQDRRCTAPLRDGAPVESESGSVSDGDD